MAIYIYMIRPTRPEMLKTGLNDHEKAAYQAHVAYLDDLEKKGVLIIAGRAEANGICIFHAESQEEAERIANADPFVSRGVVTPVVMLFNVAAGTAVSSSTR